jgi:hypothetical protein
MVLIEMNHKARSKCQHQVNLGLMPTEVAPASS